MPSNEVNNELHMMLSYCIMGYFDKAIMLATSSVFDQIWKTCFYNF